MQTWNVTLASASGHIGFHTEVRCDNDERVFALGIGQAKLATIRNLDGDVYLNSPMAPEAEDQRGLLTATQALELCERWAGVR